MTVNHVNQTPTLNVLSNVAISENAPAQTIALNGISSGATNENQTLTVTAISSKPGHDPQPDRHLLQPQLTGSITFTPVPKTLVRPPFPSPSTTAAPATTSSPELSSVTVNPVNQPPTLNLLGNVVFNENAAAQSVALNGISSGAANENQTLTVTAISSNQTLIPNPTVTYTSPNTTGSIAFTPVLNAYRHGHHFRHGQ